MSSDHTPSISIVLPVFNREKQIIQAVESVVRQSITDWELVIVDDCSDDNSFQVASSFSDPRIRLFKMPKNSGAAEARNFGIKQSSGVFIGFLDSDDTYESNFIELTLAKWKEVDLQVGFLWSGCIFHRNKEDKSAEIKMMWKPVINRNAYFTLLNDLKIGTNSGISIRRSVLDRVGLFDPILPAAEDTDLFLRIAQQYSFDHVPHYLIHINQTQNDRLSTRFDKIAIAYNHILPKHIHTIQQDKKLRLKFFYKLMWLNYHLGDSGLARYYFRMVLKDYFFLNKAWSIFLMFELLGARLGSRVHIHLSQKHNE